jgi:DNA-binding LacI/PurR family transcriptional regulator
VPGDVSVVGIDGLFLSSLMNPGLTTVRLPVPDMARTLVERVIGRIADPAMAPGEFVFQSDLIERESVAAPAKPARKHA